MFEWDSKKASVNLFKHKISFEEASSVFFDSKALDGPDHKHSDKEPRFLRIGISVLGIVLVVSYTIRRKYNEINQIRIISARKANKKEKEIYQRKN
jgi:uncharacterized DUF497 family protein